jgi:hypothetical protein
MIKVHPGTDVTSKVRLQFLEERRKTAEVGEVCIYLIVWTLTDANASYPPPGAARHFFASDLLTALRLFQRESERDAHALRSTRWTLHTVFTTSKRRA